MSVEFAASQRNGAEEELVRLGYAGMVVETPSVSAPSPSPFVLGTRRTIRLDGGTSPTIESITQSLLRARREVDLVVVHATAGNGDVAMLRRIGESAKQLGGGLGAIDVLSIDLEAAMWLRPALVHGLASQFGLVLEINISQLLVMQSGGGNRGGSHAPPRHRLLANARHAVRMLIRRRAGKLRFILSSSGRRDPQEVCSIAALFGLRQEDCERAMSTATAQELVAEGARRRVRARMAKEQEEAAAPAAHKATSSAAPSSLLSLNKKPAAAANKEDDDDSRKRLLMMWM